MRMHVCACVGRACTCFSLSGDGVSASFFAIFSSDCSTFFAEASMCFSCALILVAIVMSHSKIRSPCEMVTILPFGSTMHSGGSSSLLLLPVRSASVGVSRTCHVKCMCMQGVQGRARVALGGF